MFRKGLFLSIIIIFSYNLFYGDSNTNAERYLRISYNYYLAGNKTAAENTLNRSMEYSQSYPEQYYIKAQLSGSDESAEFDNYLNACKIIDLLGNSFLLDKSLLLKFIIPYFVRFLDYDKAVDSYRSLLSIPNIDHKADYKEFFDYLFWNGLISKYPEYKENALRYMVNTELIFYDLLYLIKTGTPELRFFNREIQKMRDNWSDPFYPLYLESLYYKSGSELVIVTGRLEALLGDQNRNNRFVIPILKNILLNLLPESDLYYRVLGLWIVNGGNGYYETISIYNSMRVYETPEDKKYFIDLMGKYTGLRIVDVNYDGFYEYAEKFTNGILETVYYNAGQRTYNEFEIIYDDYEIVSFVRRNSSLIKSILNFNINDGSLIDYGVYLNNRLQKEITFHRSTIRLEKEELFSFAPETYLEYYDTVKENNQNYSVTRYVRGLPIYKQIDENNNVNNFESIVHYTDGVPVRMESDLDNNNIFERIVYYSGDSLVKAVYSSDQSSGVYDYCEIYNGSDEEKYWDTNRDGKFDLYETVDRNTGRASLYMIDGNKDNFSFYYTIENGLVKLFDRNRTVLSVRSNDFVQSQSRGFTFISGREINRAVLPSSIEIRDLQTLTGVFYLEGKPFVFTRGLLVSDRFSYRLWIFENIRYLVDLMELE